MKTFNGKAIYNPSGKAGEYSYWACNFYVGCSNGCEYCYCKKGVLGSTMGGLVPTLKKCFVDKADAASVFFKEAFKNREELRKHGIFFSFTTDPMIPETIDLTLEAIMTCVSMEIPVKVLTKNTTWLEKKFLFGNSNFDEFTTITNWKKYVAFGFTLTGHDELEGNSSTNLERCIAMKRLHNAGFKTWASIEPIVDFPSAKNMIKQSFPFCNLYKVGLMAGKKYDIVEAQTFVEWLSEYVDNFNFTTPKIYLKESLQKLTRYTNAELGDHFVERDYNLFK